MIVLSALATSAWAIVALACALPAAALSAYSLEKERDSSISLGCVRYLSLVPIAALALALGGGRGWLGWWALGAYAPLTLALRDVLRGIDSRAPQAAYALGLTPRDVLRGVLLPLLARPCAVAMTRVLARLVGEAGLFVVVAGAPTLGPVAVRSPSAAVALGVCALGWSVLAQRSEARR